MLVVQCENKHYFDQEQYEQCPHCQRTLPKKPRRGISEMQAAPEPSRTNNTAPKDGLTPYKVPPPQGQDEKTVGIFQVQAGIEPVVGWLVCVEGGETGRDFRLHAGRNFIGRAPSCDITLDSDRKISREQHCSVIFEPIRSEFWLSRGNGDAVSVNGERLENNCKLQAEDRIVIGSYRFVFVPFCSAERSW